MQGADLGRNLSEWFCTWRTEFVGYASPMLEMENLTLPSDFHLEPELLEQLSGRPGHQRCVEGAGELLLVLHEVPKPRIPEREPLYFWKRHDGSWAQSSGEGLSELSELLERYAKAIDGHEEVIDQADTAKELFNILHHSTPLCRSSRNMVAALEQVLAIDPDDRLIMGFRDRAKEIERAADLLNTDGRMSLEFLRAELAEDYARAGARLNRIAYRLNLLAGFFLPMVALGGVFGMNVDLPSWAKPMFWVILFSGLTVGGGLLYLVGRQTGKSASYESDDE